ncbi:MAG: hypothetical protein GY772_17585 [bacterium]|nr:hypothetical protein [bacterium]
MKQPSFTINRWPVAALVSYCCLRNQGEDHVFASAAAAAVATSGAVRKNAGRGTGKSYKREAQGTLKLAAEPESFPDAYFVSGFDLDVRQETDGTWTARGWAQTQETTASFEQRCRDALSRATGGLWPELVAHVRELVKGRESVDIFAPHGAYMVIREECKKQAGRYPRVDLEKLMRLGKTETGGIEWNTSAA